VSRPEHQIRDAFDEKVMSSLTSRLVLDDKYIPDIDMRSFLESKFQQIVSRHPFRTHLPSPWPTEKHIEQLVQKSSGQFIYASTVVKIIDSPCHWPPDGLEITLGISPRGSMTPFAEMDSLYIHNLSSAHSIERVLDVFTVILF
jgi:hypothetical protein